MQNECHKRKVRASTVTFWYLQHTRSLVYKLLYNLPIRMVNPLNPLWLSVVLRLICMNSVYLCYFWLHILSFKFCWTSAWHDTAAMRRKSCLRRTRYLYDICLLSAPNTNATNLILLMISRAPNNVATVYQHIHLRSTSRSQNAERSCLIVLEYRVVRNIIASVKWRGHFDFGLGVVLTLFSECPTTDSGRMAIRFSLQMCM